MPKPNSRVTQGMPEWLDGAVTQLVQEPTSELAAAVHGELFASLEHQLTLRADLGGFKALQGPEGPEGPEGKQGKPGPEGKQGKQGIQGEPGLRGLRGPEGPEGQQGDRGHEGPRGFQGEPGEAPDITIGTVTIGVSPTDDSWMAGTLRSGPLSQKAIIETLPATFKGDTGEQGKRGLQGLQGIQGLRGPEGPIGKDGKTGPKGLTGGQGPAGTNGKNGIDGIDGVTPDLQIGTVTLSTSPQDDEWMATNIANGTKTRAAISTTLGSAFKGPKGEKGEAGSTWDGGIVVTDRNLNDIREPGIYTNGTAVTVEQGYPVAGIAGVTRNYTVARQSYLVIQEWMPLRHTTTTPKWARGVYRRAFNTQTWSPWQYQAPQRMDTTAGRALYTWDPDADREQLIYGDTGWRGIAANLYEGFIPNNSQPRCQIRRLGNTVHLLLRLQADGAILGKAKQTLVPMITIPTGFNENPSSYSLNMTGVAHKGATIEMLAAGATHTNEHLRVAGSVPVTSVWKADEIIGFNLTWSTNQPWPTVLPGTAA